MRKVPCRVQWLALLLSLLVLLPVMGLFLSSCAKEEDTLRVSVLDVGQGDAILLSQGGHHMLIDTGTAASRDALLGELQESSVGYLEYMLLTHPHEDHVGNARAVLEKYHVATLMTSKAESDEPVYQQALDAAKAKDCPRNVLEKGEVFMLGKAVCEVMYAGDAEGNNGSIVLRVCFGSNVFLFMGDAEAEVEGSLIYLYGNEEEGNRLDCDFLKVGHHGSNTASTEKLLKATTPHFAAISCGADNDYGLPDDEVLARFAEIGTSVDRTDLSGTLVYVSDGNELRQIKKD